MIRTNSTEAIYILWKPTAISKSDGLATFLAFNLKFDGPFGGRTSNGGFHSCALLSDGKVKC